MLLLLVQRMGTVINPETNTNLNNLLISDIGNIPSSLQLEEAHHHLTTTVTQLLQHNTLPFVIGGSNDQSYCNASALMAAHGGDVNNK